MSDESSSGLKLVPMLTGTDNFIAWRRAMTAWALDKGVLRILEGTELEPYRKVIDAETSPEERALIRPSESWAGLATPSGPAEANGPCSSSSNKDLTATQLKEWETWERKESKARSAILLRTSQTIITDIESMWSAAEMWSYIKATHKIDTLEHRSDVLRRLNLLQLAEKPSRTAMLEHLEKFSELCSRATIAGAPVAPWEKLEKFLMSLSEDLETFRMQFRMLDDTRRTWQELVSMYKTQADRRGAQEERMASINAFISKEARSTKAPRQPKPSANGQADRRSNESGGKQGSKEKDKGRKNSRKNDKRCDFCEHGGHVEAECNRKKAGKPSAAQIREFETKFREENTPKGAQAHFVDGYLGGAAFNIAAVGTGKGPREFLVDSGATHHIVSSLDAIGNVEIVNPPLRFSLAGSKSVISSSAKGTLTFTLPCGTSTTVENVYFVPEANRNLLSAGQLENDGWTVKLGEKTISKGRVTLTLEMDGNLYYLQLSKPKANATVEINAVVAGTSLEALHRRFGHINTPAIIELAKNGLIPGVEAKNLEAETFTMKDCDVCQRQKGTRLPKGGSSPRGSADGEMVHVDIKGPVGASEAGNTYFVAVTADYTGVRQAYPIPNKAQAFGKLQYFVVRLERQSGVKVKHIRSDQGTEFDSFEARQWYERTGMIHQMSPVYTPELNGVAERSNRTLGEMISAMVDASALGHAYWDYAARYASVILNKITTSGAGKTAWTVYTGREPTLDTVFEFGTVCFAFEPTATRTKSSFETPRAQLARVLGQWEDQSGWVVRWEHDGTIHGSRDVRMVDRPLDTPLTCKPRVPEGTKGRPSPAFPSSSPHVAPVRPVPLGPDPEARRDQNYPSGGVSPAPGTLPVLAAQPPRLVDSLPGPGTLPVPAAPPSATLPETASPSGEPAPSSEATKATTLPPEGPRRSARANKGVNSALHAMVASAAAESDEPKTVREALNGPDEAHWKDAMEQELANLVGKGTFEEVVLPSGRKAVGSKWVFKLKRDGDGKPIKYKARLVAQGFSQIPGIDFEETFAPVGRITSLRIFLTLASVHELETAQADVEGAYLNGNIDVELYMSFPDGMAPSKPSHNALRLHKSLYGLKQSGRTWWIELSKELAKLGFRKCENDWGLYVLGDVKKGQIEAILLAYVDDIAVAAKSKAKLDDLLDQLGRKWKITRLGEVTHFLGLKVIWNRSKRLVFLSQGAYIDRLIEKYPAASLKVGKYSPLPASAPPRTEDEPTVSRTTYLELVGSLMWLAGCTRPDISYSTGFLARSSANPTVVDLDQALRTLSYLSHTRTHGLELGGREKAMETFSDSDHAGCEETRRSTSGIVTFLHGSAINWASHRQATASRSSMESEYMAASDAVADILWLRALLKELGQAQDGPTVLYIDNQSAIKLAGNPRNHQRSKHIDICYHAVREQAEMGGIRIEYVPTASQKADILTKALPGPVHRVQCNFLRVRDLKGWAEPKIDTKGGGVENVDRELDV